MSPTKLPPATSFVPITVKHTHRNHKITCDTINYLFFPAGALTEAFEAFRKANNRLDPSLIGKQQSKQSSSFSPLPPQQSPSSQPPQPVRQVDPAIANQVSDLTLILTTSPHNTSH